jgi:hypothetical protein
VSVCESNASLLIIRIINREAFDSHTDPLFKENLILKFENIYLLYLGKFMYLYSSNLLPHSFDNFITPISSVHGYYTRSSNLLYVPFCRTKLRQFSASYQGPLFFNTLTPDICNASTIYSSQSKLKTYLFSRS